ADRHVADRRLALLLERVAVGIPDLEQIPIAPRIPHGEQLHASFKAKLAALDMLAIEDDLRNAVALALDIVIRPVVDDLQTFLRDLVEAQSPRARVAREAST